MSTGLSDGVDQAKLPVFRGLLAIQVAAAGLFGLVPLLLPGTFASVTGYSGDDVVVYRLAGAATTGYALMAILALRGVDWSRYRIAAIASATFTLAATIGCLLTIASGDARWIVLLVLLAAGSFTVVSAYWLRRNEGPQGNPGSPIATPFRAILALATLSAAVFGFLPVLAPTQFAQAFGVIGTDLFVFRMAGAACFGYAVAGVLEVRSAGFEAIRLQNFGAITFNGLGFLACAADIASGGRSVLSLLVLVAAGFFAVSLSVLARREGRA